MLSKSLIKYIQNLTRKKFRDEEKLFIAEGPKVSAELLEAIPHQLHSLYATQDWIDSNVQLIRNIDVNYIHTVAPGELERISSLSTPHDILAIFKQFDEINSIDTKGKIVLMLDGIQDPGNFGTIIRTADWFGIGNIICSEDCVDMYNPKVVQSTMGSIARVKIMYGGLTAWLMDHRDIPCYATVLNGESIFSLKEMKEGIIIIGNESKGINNELAGLSSKKISIPKNGGAESLNAAVAAGIVLSHFVLKK